MIPDASCEIAPEWNDRFSPFMVCSWINIYELRADWLVYNEWSCGAKTQHGQQQSLKHRRWRLEIKTSPLFSNSFIANPALHCPEFSKRSSWNGGAKCNWGSNCTGIFSLTNITARRVLVPWEESEKCQHSLYSLEHCIYDCSPFFIFLKNVFVIPWKHTHGSV